MKFNCCQLPIVNKYFVSAETKSGKKLQLSLDEKSYNHYVKIKELYPEAKLIIEE